MELPTNMKRETRKQNQCNGGAYKFCKSRTIKKIQQTREGMTTHTSHPILQSALKNQLHYHHRLFNAFECPAIPFLPNELCGRKTEKQEMHFRQKKTTCHVSAKLKRFKNWAGDTINEFCGFSLLINRFD